MIQDGIIETTPEYEVGGEGSGSRWLHGTGHPIRVPVIDLAEVSAGGGSIAWVDPAGSLRVGPRSAGAMPGPVCYDTVLQNVQNPGRLSPRLQDRPSASHANPG